MNAKMHWENIYATKAPDQVSWYQTEPRESLDLIQATGVPHSGQIIDVGAGASVLIDFLVRNGFQHLTVLDISQTALAQAKARLESEADLVTWIEADITQADLPVSHYDIWHDRAVFHFLTDAGDRAKYVNAVQRSLKPGGHIIVACFAADGPEQCSGLTVARYSPEGIRHEFGAAFELVTSRRENHQTPFGTQQKFIYCYCRKR